MSGVGDLIARLELPPGAPPVTVVTRLQTLPFWDLRWDDFEKLCLRLARSDHEVEDARRYGVPGQDQYGIDLFARRAGTGVYTVYQCKKVERFGPSDITAAVDDFLDGPWADQADCFVLCTSISMAATQLADRLEKERERLAGRGILLKPWDADELATLLKGYPALVDDFFGRQAVTAFCGSEVAARQGGGWMATRSPSTGAGCATCMRLSSPSSTPACRSRPGYRTRQLTCLAATLSRTSDR